MLHYSEFIHHEDAAARSQLEAIPGFASAVKAFLKIGFEQQMHGIFMSEKIRLSASQLPELYNLLPPVCSLLGIQEPEFYLEMNPAPNAFTFGDSRLFLCITSGLVEYLDREELESVIAHECGHIACRHVLYHTMAQYLLMGSEFLGIARHLLQPIQWGLLYWNRRSELSADRASALVAGGSKEIIETQIRLAGGPKSITDKINVEEFAAQSKAFEQLNENKWDKFLHGISELGKTHPASAIRVNEILRWTEQPHFQHLVTALHDQKNQKTACPACNKEVENGWRFCKYCGTNLR
jgi:Zn-dependent protease with chaperone function